MMPNNYQTVQDDAPVMSDMIELDTDDVIVDSVHLAPAGFPESGVPARPWNSGAAVAATSTAEDPVAQGEPDADMPAAVSATVADPEPAYEAPAATDSTSTDSQWPGIQAMFVDDPLGSVELAAGLVVDSARKLAVSIKERQDALLAARQGDDAGTEELRLALQQYRVLWNRLEDFSSEHLQHLPTEASPSPWNADAPI